MFQKFNTNTLTTKFIKNLVSTIYVPNVQVWKPGKALIKDFIYITKDYIVKAKKDYNPITDSNVDNIYNDYFDIIEPYVEGKFYPGLTSNYKSNTSIYDAETHHYLGKYLRLVRDIHNIDLMSYYNCWDGSISNRLRIKQSGSKWTVAEDNELDDGKKVLIVPINFNQKYTLYANCANKITITYAYWDGTRIINNIDTKLTISTPLVNDNITYINPLVIDEYTRTGANFVTNSPAGVLLEDYLVMLIEIPDNSINSVLVLEGDYSKNKLILTNNKVQLPNVQFGKSTDISQLTEKDYDLIFRSPSSLTTGIANQVYAFNDRLIEYLTWNTITPQDNINDNIVRIQEYIKTNKFSAQNGINYTNGDLKGDYSKALRKFLYEAIQKNKKNHVHIDINGFVDKDTEEMILRGK